MEAVELLEEHHRELEELFATLEEADASDRRGIFTAVADALLAHVEAEERHLYPAVRAAETEELLLEALEAHLAIKRAVADLLRAGYVLTDPGFLTQVQRLEDLVDEHFAEEESELYPIVRELLSPEQRVEIGAAMRATYAELAVGDQSYDPALIL